MSRPLQRSALAGMAGICLLAAAASAQTQTPASASPAPTGRPAAPSASGVRPSKMARRPPSSSRWPAHRPRGHGGALTTLGANAQARDWPTGGAYVNSALYYDFEPGRLYTIRTSPRFLTTITLKPGEKLISKAAGDTVRWVMGETVSGSGEAAQVVVFVKPIEPDLRTNIVLTTDQRTYLIEAVSAASPAYTSVLAWNYPQDQARALAVQQTRAQLLSATTVGDDIALEKLDFRYRIEPIKSRPPRWQPLRVFDDGARTYIAFPADPGTSEAPPLFVVGPKGRAELVNYRMRGSYYVVDRLIDQAELRLGEGHQTIVRITRTEARR